MALACIPADHRPAQYLYILFRQLAPERLSGADGVTSQSVSQFKKKIIYGLQPSLALLRTPSACRASLDHVAPSGLRGLWHRHPRPGHRRKIPRDAQAPDLGAAF